MAWRDVALANRVSMHSQFLSYPATVCFSVFSWLFFATLASSGLRQVVPLGIECFMLLKLAFALYALGCSGVASHFVATLRLDDRRRNTLSCDSAGTQVLRKWTWRRFEMPFSASGILFLLRRSTSGVQTIRLAQHPFGWPRVKR